MILQHYIRIAFRNFAKYKLQTVISVAGLAIGLLCFTYGLRWLEYETSYDGFYPQSAHTYAVYGIDKQTGKKSERLPLILARKLKQDFPEVKATTQIYPTFGSTFHLDDKTLEKPVECFIDTAFFSFFPRRVVSGRKEMILQNLNEIVVNRSFAVKYFQTPENAIGKYLSNGYRKSLIVTSVVEDAPNNSMFNAEIFELDEFEHRKETTASEEKQWKLCGAKIYLLLEPQADIRKFETKISEYMNKHNDAFLLKVIPVTDVRHTFGSELSFNLNYIRTFMITGLLLLLCVFFNFTNLLLNRIYQRKREIKLRNAIGADRKGLLFQLFIELTLLVLISSLLSFCLLELTFGLFTQTFETSVPQPTLLADLLLNAIFSWLLLGAICLPLLSRFIRSSSLLVSGETAPQKKGQFRRISICLQLGICIFFLMSTFIMFRQISFMKHKDLGFNPDGLIQMTMTYRDREGITQELASLAQLKSFTPGGIFTITHEPRTQNEVEWEGKPIDYTPNFQVLDVGENFPEVFEIPMLKGRFVNEGDLVKDDWQSICTKAVINEEAARIMGITDPVGKSISIWNGVTTGDGIQVKAEKEIVGVIQDFQSASLRNPILPQIILVDGSKWWSYTYFARFDPANEKAAQKAIRDVFKKHRQEGDPADCEVETFNSILQKLSTSEDASLQLFSCLAILCTLISIFGLYSISSSNMEQRRKEIAIRKVMGASSQTIVEMFFKEYMSITIVANCLALPLAWLFMQSWLEQYPYRVGIPVWMYGAVAIFTIILIICTVLYQTLKAAGMNPVDAIKSE